MSVFTLALMNSFQVVHLVFAGDCNYGHNTSDPTEFIANMARWNGVICRFCNVMYAQRSSPVCIWRMLIAFPASSRLCDLVQKLFQLLVMISLHIHSPLKGHLLHNTHTKESVSFSPDFEIVVGNNRFDWRSVSFFCR